MWVNANSCYCLGVFEATVLQSYSINLLHLVRRAFRMMEHMSEKQLGVETRNLKEQEIQKRHMFVRDKERSSAILRRFHLMDRAHKVRIPVAYVTDTQRTAMLFYYFYITLITKTRKF